MQPKTTLQYTQNGVQKIHRKINAVKACARGREADPAFALDVPHDIGLKLTNRCNLRCTHCFQWDIGGYHHALDKIELKKEGDLSIDIIKEILQKTKDVKASLYLWGGEPTLYAHWDELVDLLVEDPRETVMCTNGVAIQGQIESFLKISENLTVLFSIEGSEEIHNNLRGKGTYTKIMGNLNRLLDLQRSGAYKGNVSVEAVISDGLIPQLYDFCEHYEAMGIDSLFLNFPWYIPEAVANDMDEYFESKYGWMQTNKGKGNSWHSFDFRISNSMVDELKAQVQRILDRKWNIRIRFHPDLNGEELNAFIDGDARPAQGKTRCLGISSRIDLLPNGTVTPCKKFPEFKVGNMKGKTLEEVWNGEDYRKFREAHNNELMSICSKCETLYANGL